MRLKCIRPMRELDGFQREAHSMTTVANLFEQRDETAQRSFPAPPGLLLLLLLAAVGAGVAVSLVAESPSAWHPGYVQARSRTVAAVRDARIVKIYVKPGQLVYSGDPLLELPDHT